MKKTLVSALTTALVVGAASTTFAASNPFADVPADHWAYDAVTQLAADGVIEGYPDGSFRGDRNITRYEMAQMIAKAMAKSDLSDSDKAMLQKLQAEFAEELNNLGVRVSNLERNADMVKWNGEAQYTISRHVYKQAGKSDHTNEALFRLEPSAEVNSNWHVNARLESKLDLKEDEGKDGNVDLKRLWAQGDYKNFQIKLGRFAPIDNDSIMDTQFTGGEATVGSNVKLTVGGGRLHNEDGTFGEDGSNWHANSYVYAGLGFNKGKFDGGVSFHHLGVRNKSVMTNPSDDANIWLVRAKYNFDKNVGLGGYYAKSNADQVGSTVNPDNKNWSVQLNYKGAQAENSGTWGLWTAYRHLGKGATPYNTFDALSTNEKGWEVGLNYTFFKNVVGQFQYGNGKEIDGARQDVHTYFGRVEFFF